MSKPKVVKDYDKLPEEVVEQIKLVYPYGFTKHLVSFINREGKTRKGLPFETEDRYYLIRMNEEEAREIIRMDDDYDEDGILKDDAREDLEEKHGDEDFLNDLNANDDNSFGDDD